MRFFRVQGQKENQALGWKGTQGTEDLRRRPKGVCPRGPGGAASPGILVPVQAAAGAQQGRECRSVRAPSSACSARGSSARGCREPRPEGKKLRDEARPRGGRRTAGAQPCQLRQRRARGALGAAATHAPLATRGSVRGFLAGKGEHAWRSLARARSIATCRRGTLGMRVRGLFRAEGHAEVRFFQIP